MDNSYGLGEVHRILLDMLMELDRVCRKHGIEYMLWGGTMIGAVREGGFIPWDDDLDLAFTRENLETLIRVFPAESGRYVLTRSDTWVARIVPKEPINGERPFLDLFHFEGISEIAWQRKVKVLLLRVLQGMIKEDPDMSRFPFKRRAQLRVTHWMGLPFSKETKLRWHRWVGSHVFCGDGTAVHLPDDTFKGVGRVYPARYIEGYQDVLFEGQAFRTNRCWHEMLTMIYGDYMIPPPEEKRVSLHDKQRKAGTH